MTPPNITTVPMQFRVTKSEYHNYISTIGPQRYPWVELSLMLQDGRGCRCLLSSLWCRLNYFFLSLVSMSARVVMPLKAQIRAFRKFASEDTKALLMAESLGMWQSCANNSYNALRQLGILKKQPTTKIVPIVDHEFHSHIGLVILSIRKRLSSRDIASILRDTFHIPLYNITQRRTPKWRHVLLNHRPRIKMNASFTCCFISKHVPSAESTFLALSCPKGHIRGTFKAGLNGISHQQLWCKVCHKAWHSHRWTCPCKISWLHCIKHVDLYKSLARGLPITHTSHY